LFWCITPGQSEGVTNARPSKTHDEKAGLDELRMEMEHRHECVEVLDEAFALDEKNRGDCLENAARVRRKIVGEHVRAKLEGGAIELVVAEGKRKSGISQLFAFAVNLDVVISGGEMRVVGKTQQLGDGLGANGSAERVAVASPIATAGLASVPTLTEDRTIRKKNEAARKHDLNVPMDEIGLGAALMLIGTVGGVVEKLVLRDGHVELGHIRAGNGEAGELAEDGLGVGGGEANADRGVLVKTTRPALSIYIAASESFDGVIDETDGLDDAGVLGNLGDLILEEHEARRRSTDLEQLVGGVELKLKGANQLPFIANGEVEVRDELPNDGSLGLPGENAGVTGVRAEVDRRNGAEELAD
jgi:hypothetical protein